MTPENEEIEQVTFKYTKTDDYRNVHGSGVFGGVTAKIEIRIEVFTEYQPSPSEYSKKVIDDELVPVDEEEDGDKDILVERERQIGIMLALNEARSIHQWLGNKIEQLEERLEQ